MAGLTALQVLDLAGVVAGQRVLVHAAAGGVGHLAVQLAKARGAYVLGTARAEKHDFLRDLGIDEPIDTRLGLHSRARLRQSVGVPLPRSGLAPGGTPCPCSIR